MNSTFFFGDSSNLKLKAIFFRLNLLSRPELAELNESLDVLLNNSLSSMCEQPEGKLNLSSSTI